MTRCSALLVLALLCGSAEAGELEATCVAASSKAWPASKRAPGEHSSVTGDFDDDGKPDVAVRIERSPYGPAIAVCLSSKPGEPLLRSSLAQGPLSLARKGDRFYNYDEDKFDVYPRDGIATSDGCCGGTFLYEDGAFYKVEDSD